MVIAYLVLTKRPTWSRLDAWKNGAPAVTTIGLSILSLAILIALKSHEARSVELLMCKALLEPCRKTSWFDTSLLEDRDLQAAIAMLFVTCVLVLSGRRWTFGIPLGILIFGPLVIGEYPQVITGGGWMNPWKGGAIEFCLLALPAAVLAFNSKKSEPIWKTDLAASLFVIGLALIAIKTWDFLVDADISSITVVGSIFSVGLLASKRKSYRILIALVAVAPIFFARSNHGMNIWYGSPQIGALSVLYIPFFLGLSAQPLGSFFTKLQRSPRNLLIIVNGLNITDAIFTAAAIHIGTAVEANPIVRWIGLPLKIIGVLVLSIVIARCKPKLLIIPLAVLMAVFIYHLTGIFTYA